VLALCGCAFEDSPLIASGGRTPSSGGGSNQDDTDEPSGSSGQSGSGGEDGPDAAAPNGDDRDAASSMPDAASAPLELDASNSGGAGTTGGAGAGPEPDAGTDAGEPDASTPECLEPAPACVCAHTRLQTPADPCAAPDCPLDDCAPDSQCTLERFESSVYYVCTEPHSQADALAHCAAIEGMHLVFVESAGEDEFLDDVVSGKVWIGAELDEGVWSWLDGTAFYEDGAVEDAYVNWDDSQSEPNGLGVGNGEVTCAIFWSETSAWADTNCPANNGYVCEREL
jgi:hypothetical protein